MKASRRPWALVAVRYGLAAMAFLPLGWMAVRDAAAIRAALGGVNWLQLSFSTLSLGIVLPFMASMSWVSLRGLGAKFPLRKAFAIYFVTQAAKYLPGGIWAFPGRVAAYEMAGLHRAYAALSVLREVAVLFLGAALVSVGGLFQGVLVDAATQWAVALGAIACLTGLGLTHTRWFWTTLARFPLLRRSPVAGLSAEIPSALTDIRWLPPALGCSVAFWLAMGPPFWQLILAISPQATLNAGQAGALFALAWAVGFLVILAPAGLGVREITLTLLLAPFLPAAAAVSVALLSRLWWMTVEAICIAVSVGILGTGKK